MCVCVCVVEKRVKRFLRDVADQWRSLAVEVRSVRSMLEEVQGNWEKYSGCVASLQAWLEDAERALRQPENTKRVSCTTHGVYEECRRRSGRRSYRFDKMAWRFVTDFAYDVEVLFINLF